MPWQQRHVLREPVLPRDTCVAWADLPLPAGRRLLHGLRCDAGLDAGIVHLRSEEGRLCEEGGVGLPWHGNGVLRQPVLPRLRGLGEPDLPLPFGGPDLRRLCGALRAMPWQQRHVLREPVLPRDTCVAWADLPLPAGRRLLHGLRCDAGLLSIVSGCVVSVLLHLRPSSDTCTVYGTL